MSKDTSIATALRGSDSAEWSIAVINGPNMNMLGRRDPTLYGSITSLAELERAVTEFGRILGVHVKHFQSNHEGEILDFIHSSIDTTDGYLLNPAGFWGYGAAIAHALKDSGKPFVETHFANVATIPGESVFTSFATGEVMGFRQYSYHAALMALVLSLDDASFLGPHMR